MPNVAAASQHGAANRIEEYILGQEIGRGGFGVVFLALDTSTGKSVAIKRLSLSNMSEEDVQITQKEIELLQRLSHPNIVKYLHSMRKKDFLYIVLEFVENGSLTGLIKKFGNFNEALAAVYISQVLEGLAFLHGQGVIHRDIKGANILTTKEGFVKLADFGVAMQKGVDQDKDVVGTPYWMAPEVIEMAGASAACDIWSVGCTIIEMLTGQPPYFDLSPMTALFRIVQDEYPPLPEHISPALRDFLVQCFHKEPSYRKSAKDLLMHPWIMNTAKSNAMNRSSVDLNDVSDLLPRDTMSTAAAAINRARAGKSALLRKKGAKDIASQIAAAAFGEDEEDNDEGLARLQASTVSKRENGDMKSNEGSRDKQSRSDPQVNFVSLEEMQRYEKILRNIYNISLQGVFRREKERGRGPTKLEPLHLLSIDENDELPSHKPSTDSSTANQNQTDKKGVESLDEEDWDAEFGSPSQATPESSSFPSSSGAQLLQQPYNKSDKTQTSKSDDSDDDWDAEFAGSPVPALSNGLNSKISSDAMSKRIQATKLALNANNQQKRAVPVVADELEDEDWDANIRDGAGPTQDARHHSRNRSVFAGALGKSIDMAAAFGDDDPQKIGTKQHNQDSGPVSSSTPRHDSVSAALAMQRQELTHLQENDDDDDWGDIGNVGIAKSKRNAEPSSQTVSQTSKKQAPVLALKPDALRRRLQNKTMVAQSSNDDVVLDIDDALEEQDAYETVYSRSGLGSGGKSTGSHDVLMRRQEMLVSHIRKLTPQAEASTVLRSCKVLRGFFRDSPVLRRHFVKRHGILPLLELLQFWQPDETLPTQLSEVDAFKTRVRVVCSLLALLNQLVHEDPELHESLALVGVTPAVMNFVQPRFTSEIRYHASIFIDKCCLSSKLTLQLFVACGGAAVLVNLLRPSAELLLDQFDPDSRSFDQQSDISEVSVQGNEQLDDAESKGAADQVLLRRALRGILTVMNLHTVAMTQNEFRRVFIRAGVLEPIAQALRASFYFICHAASRSVSAEQERRNASKNANRATMKEENVRLRSRAFDNDGDVADDLGAAFWTLTPDAFRREGGVAVVNRRRKATLSGNFDSIAETALKSLGQHDRKLSATGSEHSATNSYTAVREIHHINRRTDASGQANKGKFAAPSAKFPSTLAKHNVRRNVSAELSDGSDSSEDEDDSKHDFWRPHGMKDLAFTGVSGSQSTLVSNNQPSSPVRSNVGTQNTPHSQTKPTASAPSPVSTASSEAPVSIESLALLPSLDGPLLTVLNDMQQIANVLVLFSQGDSYVKSALAQPTLIRVLLYMLRPAPYSLLFHPAYAPIIHAVLKTIRHMSMETNAIEVLDEIGAIGTLVPFLARETSDENEIVDSSIGNGSKQGSGLSDMHRKEIRHFVLHALFNMCRVSRKRQQAAAAAGIIMPLQRIVKNYPSLGPLALPLLCDLAQAGPAVRRKLWQHDGVGMYIDMLSHNYWAMPALNSLATWQQREPQAVEEILLKRQNIRKLVRMFTERQNYFETIVGHLDGILERAPKLARALSKLPDFMAQLTMRLRLPHSAIVKRALLNMVGHVYEKAEDKKMFETMYALKPLISRIARDAERGNQVLVAQVASKLAKKFQNAK